MSKHHLNPFDFVPFANETPDLKTVEQWRSLDPQGVVTGYFELQIEASTPVHIVGRQDNATSNGHKLSQSHFCRRGNQALIPGSSIRGLLRAFIEAACNGWASQMTPHYEKKPSVRHVGFRVIKDSGETAAQTTKLNVDERLGVALPAKFAPVVASDNKVDLASFLFGYVSPQSNAWRGAVRIVDALIPIDTLAFAGPAGSYLIPDIDDSAFMGGPKPSASSWWYMHPHSVRLRRTSKGATSEFIGQGFRGRKFYYHQNPQRCVAWYGGRNASGKPNWPTREAHPLYTYPVECLPAGAKTQAFRAYFEEIPEACLQLLLWALSPGNRLRHKIGYGKAYGYGSIAIETVGGSFRASRFSDPPLQPILARKDAIHAALWHREQLGNQGVGGFLHWPSLEKLAKILWWDENSSLLFTYPPFKDGGFLPSVRPNQLTDLLPDKDAEDFERGAPIGLKKRGDILARKLAENNLRPALHFDVYQRNSSDFAAVDNRKLENAI